MRGERLHAFVRAGMAAIVGEMRARPQASPRNLRAYHSALERLADELPAVLPARFGTSMHDLEELAWVMEARARSLRSGLRLVRSRVQMTVRFARPAADNRISPPPVDRTSGRAYLRSREAAHRQLLRADECITLRNAVKRWVRDERVEARAGVLTVYHLIPRASADAYRNAAHRAFASGFVPEVGGPYPAFAFA